MNAQNNIASRMNDLPNKGSFIAIAWPETLVNQEGKWYDHPLQWLGINKNGSYKVGHAAFVLVDHHRKEFNYYDFGRYHTPPKHGRVRSAETDPELTIRTIPVIQNGVVENVEDMLIELQSNTACHGDGKLMASNLNDINVVLAKRYITERQSHSSIPYGPIKLGGTNCSRFVCQTARRATKSLLLKVLLTIPYTISPSPMFNVRVINSTSQIHVVRGTKTDSVERLIPNWVNRS